MNSTFFFVYFFSPNDRKDTQVIYKVGTDEVRTSDGNTSNLFNRVKVHLCVLLTIVSKQLGFAESQTEKLTTQQPEATANDVKPKQATVTQTFDKGAPYKNGGKR